MSKLTITEGLAEIKTIDKRVQKKREFITAHLVRQEQLKDPLASSGGSAQAIKRERQAIADLQERKIAIRRAIQEANATTVLEVCAEERTIASWLVWRREVAPSLQAFYSQIRNSVNHIRGEAQKRGHMMVAAEAIAKPGDIVVNLDEKELADSIEHLEEVLGTLDGALSLKNATTFIDI